MDATLHPLFRKAVVLPSDGLLRIQRAEKLQDDGKWYLASEEYLEIAKSIEGDVFPGACVLTRAAGCFELAGQLRAAARAYSKAGSLLQNSRQELQSSGELFNRSALAFQAVGEYFNAGTAWRNAGKVFCDIEEPIITSKDNIKPIPYSAGRFTVAGACYTAAGDAFERCGDEAKWACMAYWESGQAHARQGHGYHAFIAYKKALVAGIRYYGTHERMALRRYLPLSEEERAVKTDPIAMLEQALLSGYEQHQKLNESVLGPRWARQETDRQIVLAYHEFYLEFAKIGNVREAGIYRAEKHESTRRIYMAEREYGKALLYWIWWFTSGYGESLKRWSAVSLSVIAIFGLAYWAFGLIVPAGHWFDYFYFSTVTFTSLGYGDIHPEGVWGKLLASVEIMGGLVMFGLLLTFVGNRFQRV